MKFERFAQLLASTFDLDGELKPSDRLVEDLAFDSLDLLELWVAVEHAVGRPVDPGAIEEIVTVEDAYLCLEALR